MVCDEGHVMRNSQSGISMILGRVSTLCRIVLTGTPLQNNLLECEYCESIHKHSLHISTGNISKCMYGPLMYELRDQFHMYAHMSIYSVSVYTVSSTSV